MSNTHRTTRTQNSRESRKSEREDEQETPEEIEQEPEPAAKPRRTRRAPRPSSDGEESTHEPEGRRPPLMEVLRQARGQLAELTGLEAESVSSFEQTEDGWSLEVEVLELSRVPDTMSLMGSYLVELDREGQLTGYRRVRRYERGRAER
ncbi:MULTISPECIES: gas vesicle protein [unclassified Streptomyces]|uniref:gas vesicle protein GvpO n=1 Tax=unclassified Streptomyces TaxID=2593676 RepID=UPI000DB9646D|nr:MULTISPECIES: gas vesicle protein [unclassified Streptomyces]MYU05466.1 gas vesicle protein [Streptomyces sp. SID8366]MYU67564.1 gas vesicle protein [Streptomyces sp. SID69]RAJ66352.1 gas vesicle protein GvpO [Streptomyces sp. PsTaAH-130]